MNHTNPCLLTTQDLSIRFGGLVAVDCVDLQVERGTVLGLIGPNGSGKTTIFNMITGLYTPTSGEILFDGKSLVARPVYEIARMGISRTFQTSRLCLDLSVLDNVFIGMHPTLNQSIWEAVFGRKILSREMAEARERAVDLLRVFNPDLERRVGDPAKSLSQIDRRRVEICRAMAMNPKLLLLDEPSAGMNPEEISDLMDDIQKVKQESKDISIIIVEHVMSVIRTITDRVVVLNFGRKIAEGTFQDVVHRPEVREAYLGKRGH